MYAQRSVAWVLNLAADGCLRRHQAPAEAQDDRWYDETLKQRFCRDSDYEEVCACEGPAGSSRPPKKANATILPGVEVHGIGTESQANTSLSWHIAAWRAMTLIVPPRAEVEGGTHQGPQAPIKRLADRQSQAVGTRTMPQKEGNGKPCSS